MKKSEFDEELGKKAGWRTENRHAGEWILIDRSDLHETLKKAGVQWDSEIERLELEVDGDGVIVVDGRDRMWLDLSLVDDERPLSLSEREKIKELLACHNFLHRLNLDDHDGVDFTLALLRKLIREEREKLR